MTELFDVYDINRNKTGKMVRRGIDKLEDGEFHLVTNIAFINERDEILIQKRALEKKQYPGLYGLTGGAVTAGEDSLCGCWREAKEEIGYEPDLSRAICVTHVIGHTIVDTFILREDLDIRDLELQKSEVAEVMWMKDQEVRKNIADEKVLPKTVPGVLVCLDLIEQRKI